MWEPQRASFKAADLTTWGGITALDIHTQAPPLCQTVTEKLADAKDFSA